MIYDNNIYARILSGEISEDEENELKKKGDWEKIMTILQAAESLEAPEYNKEKQYNLVQAKKSKSVKSNRPKIIRLVSGLAAAALIGIVMIWTIQNANISISAPNQEISSNILPDGSQVILNAGSSLSYSKSNFITQRKAELVGEAFFEVEKGMTFTINTDFGSITVLGTSFNVRTWDKRLYVACYTGKVKIITTGGELILSPKEQVWFEKESLSEISAINGESPSWQSNQTTIYSLDINYVFEEIERQYDVSIKRQNIKGIFDGSFIHGNIDKALSQVCKPMGLNYKLIDVNTFEVIEE